MAEETKNDPFTVDGQTYTLKELTISDFKAIEEKKIDVYKFAGENLPTPNEVGFLAYIALKRAGCKLSEEEICENVGFIAGMDVFRSAMDLSALRGGQQKTDNIYNSSIPLVPSTDGLKIPPADSHIQKPTG